MNGHAQRSATERAAELEREAYEAFKTGNADRSRTLNLESLALAEEAGDASATAQALAGLMRLALRDADFEQVEALARRCNEVAERTGDRSLARMPLHMRAEAARMRGDFARARDLYDASIALNRELGNDKMVAVELANKAWVEIGSARLDAAERLVHESVAAGGADDDYGLAFSLLGLARVELERGSAQGVEILGAADAALHRAGLVWDPAEEREHRATLDLARTLAGTELDAKLATGAADPRSFLRPP